MSKSTRSDRRRASLKDTDVRRLRVISTTIVGSEFQIAFDGPLVVNPTGETTGMEVRPADHSLDWNTVGGFYQPSPNTLQCATGDALGRPPEAGDEWRLLTTVTNVGGQNSILEFPQSGVMV